jgi:hypothetical protein
MEARLLGEGIAWDSFVGVESKKLWYLGAASIRIVVVTLATGDGRGTYDIWWRRAASGEMRGISLRGRRIHHGRVHPIPLRMAHESRCLRRLEQHPKPSVSFLPFPPSPPSPPSLFSQHSSSTPKPSAILGHLTATYSIINQPMLATTHDPPNNLRPKNLSRSSKLTQFLGLNGTWLKKANKYTSSENVAAGSNINKSMVISTCRVSCISVKRSNSMNCSLRRPSRRRAARGSSSDRIRLVSSATSVGRPHVRVSLCAASHSRVGSIHHA